MSREPDVMGSAWRTAQLASCSRRPLKNASWPTNTASGRSRPNAAKAASISRLVLALKIWSCSPMARPAASTSRKVICALALLAELTSTATRTGRRQHFAQQLKPLCRQFETQQIDAGQIPPRARQAGNETKLDRVFGDREYDGNRR